MLEEITEIECLTAITSSLAKGDGCRHLWIGYTGCGKTIANQRLAGFMLDEMGQIVITTDQKSRVTGYPGVQIASATNLHSLGNERAAVVRASALTKNLTDSIDFDSVCSRVWNIGHTGNGNVALCIDELYDACQSEQTWNKPRVPRGASPAVPMIRRLYTQGRSLGISIAAATQFPQEIPREAFGMSESMGIFQAESRETDYYIRLGILDPEHAEIVKRLKVGDFLFRKRGMPPALCRFSFTEQKKDA